MPHESFRFAAEIHMQYRAAADNAIQAYSDLRTSFPFGSFPKHSARVWRFGMLAKMWGVIATDLSGGRVDYLKNWRTGK